MAALIEFFCTAQHDRREDPSVTVEQGSWAYCSSGANDGHRWTRIDPTSVEALRSIGASGHSRVMADRNAETAKVRGT